MIKKIKFLESKEIPSEQLEKLYSENGWILYTRDMDSLVRGVKNSLYVLSAWKEDELIGLIRLVGDGETMIYILDILLLKEYQGIGIGTELMSRVLERYEGVRQKVLLTGTSKQQESFYRKTGFKPVSELECVAFIKQ